MIKPFLSFLLCLCTAGVAVAQTYSASAARPSLPAAAPGAPGPNAWATDEPVRVYEDDGATGDDFMGDASVTGTTATFRWDSTTMTVLLGEWLEFDCVEIDFYWTYWTWQQFTYYRVTPYGWVEVVEWRRVKATVCGQTQVVCP